MIHLLYVSHVASFGLTVGYQTLACPESFYGTNVRAMEEEVRRKIDAYANMLLPSYEQYESGGVRLSSKRFYKHHFY